MTLTVYWAPIASKAVADITTDDVLRILKPLWLTKRVYGGLAGTEFIAST